MKDLKKLSLSSYSLSLDDNYNLVFFEGQWLEGKTLYTPHLCITVNNFEYLWEELLDCNLAVGVGIGSSLTYYLFVRVFGSTNISLAHSVAKQIRNTVIDMLPCKMTVEDFSCIIDSVVNKYKE